MVIAVDAGLLNRKINKDSVRFILDILLMIAKENPSHQFVFYSDRPIVFDTEHRENIQLVARGPIIKNQLSLRWWYDVRLPILLKKVKAEVLFCPSGFCSLRTKVPQLFWFDDYSLKQKKPIQPLHKRQRFVASLRKAKLICSPSLFLKQSLSEDFKIDKEKIQVLHGLSKDEIEPIEWDQREVLKNSFAEGCEYFLCRCTNKGSVTISLKAFSIFKKWQKSNMKLLLVTHVRNEEVSLLISTYKHKADVVLLNDHSPIDKIQTAAYAMIYVQDIESYAFPVIDSIKAGVPVIIAGDHSAFEKAGGSALWSEYEIADMAEKMKLIYKDENKRNLLIENGKIQAEALRTKQSSDDLWKLLTMLTDRQPIL